MSRGLGDVYKRQQLDCLFNFSSSNTGTEVPHCGLNLHFYNDAEHFLMLICHLYVKFGEVFIQIFCLFFLNQVVYLVLNVEASLHVLDTCLHGFHVYTLQRYSSVLWIIIF